MEEKHGAIWIKIEVDGVAQVAFEHYFPSIQKQANGTFLPYSFVPKSDPQWRLPLWSQENEKAMMPTLESAKEYLKHYAM